MRYRRHHFPAHRFILIREHDEGWMIGRGEIIHETLADAWEAASSIASADAAADDRPAPEIRVVTATVPGRRAAMSLRHRTNGAIEIRP